MCIISKLKYIGFLLAYTDFATLVVAPKGYSLYFLLNFNGCL